ENKLILRNLGNNDLYLWGDKFGAHDRDMLREGCLVPATGQTDLPLDHLETWARDAIGHDGRQSVPLAMYFADESGVHKFTGTFLLLIKIKRGVVTVDARTPVVTSQPW